MIVHSYVSLAYKAVYGNMTLDTGRGIGSVTYNCLNLPVRIACDGGSSVSFEYDALGAKLTEIDSIPAPS